MLIFLTEVVQITFWGKSNLTCHGNTSEATKAQAKSGKQPHIFWWNYASKDGLQMPGEEIAFTAQPKINSHSQTFWYDQSIFCLPHQPKFSGFFNLCHHWVSIVRGLQSKNCSSFGKNWFSNDNFVSLSQESQSERLKTEQKTQVSNLRIVMVPVFQAFLSDLTTTMFSNG